MAEISLSAFRHNWREIQSLLSPQTRILAVVKANAYGHGALLIAKEAERLGAAFLGVATVEEGVALRQAGSECPILTLGSLYPFAESFAAAIEYRLTLSVASRAALAALLAILDKGSTLRRRIPVHLKVDTGMGRIGVLPETALDLAQCAALDARIFLEGIYSHLSSAESDPDFTRLQIERFSALRERLEKEGIQVPFYHLTGSSGIMKYPESHFTLVRPGILLYGLSPDEKPPSVDVRPVMRLKTRVIFVKRVASGTRLSYGGDFVTKRDSWIATLPIGYGDGYPRALTGLASALIKGKRQPIVGRICMDMCLADVTEASPVSVGEEVVLLGAQGSERISAEELAQELGTSPYEVVTQIRSRVPRIPKND